MTEQIDMEQGVPPVEPGYIPQDDGLAGVTNRDSETRQVRDQFAAFVLLKAFLYLVLAFSGLIAISTSFNGVTFSATLLFNGLLTLLATYTANCLIANSLVDVFDPSVLNKVMAHSFLVVMYLLSFIIAWAEKVTTDASMFALFGHFVCLLLLSSIAWILLMVRMAKHFLKKLN